jgi:predicted nucleic acid-binding protein
VNKAYGILHRGELEVVVSALENNIKVVIIDEKTARDFSQTLNLKPLGIIGVLNLAKQKGKITSIKPYLDQLIRNKYRISEKIYHQELQKAGELI